MTALTGMSGARVYIVGDEAIKVHETNVLKVHEQARWLQTHKSDYLPNVTSLQTTGYCMETLAPIPTSEVDLGSVVEALERGVWCNDGVHKVDVAKTLLKTGSILERHAPDLLEKALLKFAEIEPTVAVLTHGDPTAENVMLRGDTYVITDPVPSSEAVPDDMAVDVGKILQSAYGWEALKGQEACSYTPDDVHVLFDAHTADMAELWCVVHFIRTLPYVPKGLKPDVITTIAKLLGF